MPKTDHTESAQPDPDLPTRTIQDIARFLRRNDELIDSIIASSKTSLHLVGQFADSLEQNRLEAAAMLKNVDRLKFSIASDRQTRKKQKGLLKKIRRVNKRIRKFSDAPSLLTGLFLERSGLYLDLGNTYSDTFADLVQFTEEEVAQLRKQLRRAVLDTESRQRMASILDGAVSVSKFALSMALRLT
jgi:hypothetical protein